MELTSHEKQVREVEAADLALFIDHHYPDAAVNDDVVSDLFQYPCSDTVHLVRAQEGLSAYNTKAVTEWLSGERGGGADGYPDGVFSFMAAEGKIPFGEYLVVFN